MIGRLLSRDVTALKRGATRLGSVQRGPSSSTTLAALTAPFPQKLKVFILLVHADLSDRRAPLEHEARVHVEEVPEHAAIRDLLAADREPDAADGAELLLRDLQLHTLHGVCHADG